MKRREFIETGVLATSGMMVLPSILGNASVLGANEKLNIGVIGTGSRGQGLLSIIAKMSGINAIGCCDVIPFRLEEGLNHTDKNAKGYKDYRKLLENKDIDAVIISTPFSMHSSMAMDALDAGKHVYCEKTMAKGMDGTKDLVSQVELSDKIFQVGHQYHSSRLYVHVVDLIKKGEIGEIAAIQCQWNRNGDWRRPVPDPKWERLINWRMYKEYSGGLVAELCSHQMDIANWILESTPLRVSGFGGIDYWKDGRETYDNVHFIWEYASGVKASYTSLTTNAKGDYKIKVMGKKGTITIDYTQAWFYPEAEEERKKGIMDGVSGATVEWDEAKGYPIKIDHIDPSQQALMDFQENIINNTKPDSNIHTGAQASVMVQMALDAMENRSVEEWSEDYNL